METALAVNVRKIYNIDRTVKLRVEPFEIRMRAGWGCNGQAEIIVMKTK